MGVLKILPPLRGVKGFMGYLKTSTGIFPEKTLRIANLQFRKLQCGKKYCNLLYFYHNCGKGISKSGNSQKVKAVNIL